MSFSSVDLPAPFAPIRPSRSPRMMRSVRSRTSTRPPNALVTCDSSATSRPDRSPASTASLTLPSRARRSLRSRRSDSSLRTPAFVARAPRFDALADPRFLLRPELVELAPCRRLGFELDGLPRLVGGEVARIGTQQAAVELDDARGHAVEKRAVVRDHDDGGHPGDEVLDPRDAVDVEVIGRLVQQQEVGLEREGQRERGALPLAAGRRLRRGRLVETEAMQELDEPRLRAPPFALVVNGVESAAQREAFAQRRRARQHRFLLHEHDRQAVPRLDLPVVELTQPGDDLQQRRLARAVAADETDALAFADDDAGAVEQRMEAEGELGVLQGHERHGRRIVQGRLPGDGSRRSAARSSALPWRI